VNCQTELTVEAPTTCGADDILENCRRFASLTEALNSFNLSIGTSSRRIDWFPQVYTPHELAGRLADLAQDQKIALVFGPERTGLTNEHINHCQWLVTIPSNPEFESMNLAHAVAIVSYEIYRQMVRAPLGRPLELARLDQVEAFFGQLEASLIEIGFLNQEDPKRIMATLRQILGRAKLEERDVSILRGVLRQWSWYAEKVQKESHSVYLTDLFEDRANVIASVIIRNNRAVINMRKRSAKAHPLLLPIMAFRSSALLEKFDERWRDLPSVGRQDVPVH
jgi:TrmH family RNA methyltransferase